MEDTKREFEDTGLDTKNLKYTKRLINTDGTFNVQRTGADYFFKDTYQKLTNISWLKFHLILFLSYLIINCFFGLLYLSLGINNLHGATNGTLFHEFMQAFNFSFQTFTTVGYGVLAPKSDSINFIASLQAMMGFLTFALATGLMYGRFSRPSAKLIFSKNILIAPYQNAWSLQFRIANERANTLMEMKAQMILQVSKNKKGEPVQDFRGLQLELDEILFFPLNWTIVHKVDEKSPFYGFKSTDFQNLEFEILVHIKGFDDTFSQTVHRRYSYLIDDLIIGAKFEPTYEINEIGDINLSLDKIHHYKKVKYEV